MAITNALASVTVKDLAKSVAWYQTLFRGRPDSTPMPREVRLRAHRKLLAVRVSRIEFGHANRLSLSSQGVDTANDTLKESI